MRLCDARHLDDREGSVVVNAGHLELAYLGRKVRRTDVHLLRDVLCYDVHDELAGAANVPRSILGDESVRGTSVTPMPTIGGSVHR